MTENALIKNINEYEKGKIKINKTGNEELDDLIKKLLVKEASKRLSWDEYFNHPFFIKENKINLIYFVNKDSYFNWLGIKIEKVNIFGEDFVENNKDNIELIINGIKCELLYNYKLKDGENNIQLIIKNSDAVILVYAINDINSFNSLDMWLSKLNDATDISKKK